MKIISKLKLKYTSAHSLRVIERKIHQDQPETHTVFAVFLAISNAFSIESAIAKATPNRRVPAISGLPNNRNWVSDP